MEGYDVVVIGAGNGGLTASAALAQKGLNVLLLERHNVPGGCATSFCRGRFEFEVALHQLSGMGTPDRPGPLRLMLGSLGVLDDLEFVEMSDLYRVVVPGGVDVRLKAERSQVVEALQGQFPKEKEAIERFFDLCYRYANQMLAAFYFRDPDVSRKKYPALYEYAFKNAKEVLDGFFSDPLLKAVLSVYWGFLGLPPDRLAFPYLAMLFFTFIEFKPFHIKGGSQALSNALVHKFLSNGGSVRFNCGVKKIIVESGAVQGVVTQDGDQIPAKYVVSNASQVSTYVELIDPEHVPGEASREMRGRSLSPSAFVVFIGFDCEPGELGIADSMSFILSHTDIADLPYNQMRKLDIDSDLMVLSCYDVADPDFSPQGACQVAAVTLKFAEPWLRIPPTQYARVKYRCAEAMLRQVESIYPDLRRHIEEIEVATPLTHMRYLGHPGGAIYGFEHHTKDALFFPPSRRSPIEGLYFASGWVGDAGFQTTLQSGASAARAIVRELEHNGGTP